MKYPIEVLQNQVISLKEESRKRSEAQPEIAESYNQKIKDCEAAILILQNTKVESTGEAEDAT